MVTQVPVSARLDSTLKWKIDQETMKSGWTRNRILNLGAEYWLEVHEAQQLFFSHGSSEEFTRKIITGLVKRLCPWARGLGKIEIEL